MRKKMGKGGESDGDVRVLVSTYKKDCTASYLWLLGKKLTDICE